MIEMIDMKTQITNCKLSHCTKKYFYDEYNIILNVVNDTMIHLHFQHRNYTKKPLIIVIM